MKIVFLPETLDYFNELSDLLYEKDYFGFREEALSYVDTLLSDIRNKLHRKLAKPAPEYFDRYGKNMLYATFRKSRNTQWYVFFNIYRQNGETIYLIRYISNNHVNAQNI